MFRSFQRFIRLLHINLICARFGLLDLLTKHGFLSGLRPLIYLNPWHWFGPSQQLARGDRLRIALETLGPIFVKFGQTLSTRPDLLPPDIAAALAKLQDRVPAFDGQQAIHIIETDLKQSIDFLFKQFDPTPFAAASIAQVHHAYLHTGERVVVKVLRPHIHKLVTRDVDLLYACANILERHWTDARRLRLRDVVAEFDQIIHDELDLRREAANASQLRRNFEQSPLLYVPQIYWPYISEHVLTIEYIEGIPIADLAQLQERNVNLKRLSENGVEIFFTQVFRDAFFHADMHPGNIFIDASNPDYPKYAAVDFGIMGSLSDQDQRYLAENLLAFFNRNYRRVAELHIESGWIPKNTRVDQFESAIRAVCEPIFERPLKEISFGALLLGLFQTARRFNMEIQPQLVLLQKTLFNIEGLGRQLYPDLDLWSTAKPFLELWMRERSSVAKLLKKVCERLPIWLGRIMEKLD